jgi:formylglycine-generating enzyme required for sulfatase activity
MAGNVWEWTASVWQSYPGAEEAFTDEDLRVLRGGDYSGGRTNVRCGARYRFLPGGDFILLIDLGFRIVVAPPLGHSR